jgi:hypothetical protein
VSPNPSKIKTILYGPLLRLLEADKKKRALQIGKCGMVLVQVFLSQVRHADENENRNSRLTFLVHQISDKLTVPLV